MSSVVWLVKLKQNHYAWILEASLIQLSRLFFQISSLRSKVLRFWQAMKVDSEPPLSCWLFSLNKAIFSCQIFQSKEALHILLWQTIAFSVTRKMPCFTMQLENNLQVPHVLTASVWMGWTAKNTAVTKASRLSLKTALSQVYISSSVTRQCRATFTAWK